MKQFLNIFRFEFLNMVKTKSFIITTAILILAAAVTLFFPRFFGSEQSPGSSGDSSTTLEQGQGMYFGKEVAVLDLTGALAGTGELFSSALGCNAHEYTRGVSELEEQVRAGTYHMGIVLEGPLKFKVIVKTLEMYESPESIISEVLTGAYTAGQLAALGADEGQIQSLLSAVARGETVTLQTDRMHNFFYTYLLMMMLYMAILIYGQIVSQSVATEKSSRAMELLITSAKPSALMFGKVIGAGVSGVLQIICVLGSVIVCYCANRGYWEDNQIISSLFGIPVSMLLYTVLFFLLGFFIYAFMFGAVGSLASRIEDVSILAMPITLLFIATFMIAVFGMIGGNVDSTMMKVFSFIPLTSPIIMFVRISMGDVPAAQIIISVVLQLLALIVIGYASAGIYRAGVLLYGKPPKPVEIIKLLRFAVKSKR